MIRVLTSTIAALALLAGGVTPASASTLTAQAARPRVTSASTQVASTAGGTVIVLTGRHLGRVKAVWFGKTRSSRLSHPSKTRLSVVAPQHAAGWVKLRLRAGGKNFSTPIRVHYSSPAPAPAPTGSLAQAEAEVLRLTNAARARGYTCTSSSSRTVMPPVPPLRPNATLAALARAHSDEMAARGYFSHDSADGTHFSARLTNGGYRWSAAAENIAAGQDSAAEVVGSWLGSYGHCTNLMSANYTERGVGLAVGGSWGRYWTQDFARPRA